MWYLKSAFDTYEKVQDAVQSRLGEVQSAILSPVDMMRQLLASPASSEKRAPSPVETDSELETLRKRVAELEKRLEPRARPKQRLRRKQKGRV